MRIVKLAVAQYPLDRFDDLDAYEAKIVDWVSRAAARGAELLVFPEYAAMELAALAGDTPRQDVLDRLAPEVDALHRMLARRHGVHILAAGRPERDGDAAVRAVATLFAPGGAAGRQEKIVPTPYEREVWGVAGGGPVVAFRTSLGTIGVSVGSDVAFPLIARAQAEAGAELLLVPASTGSPAAYARIRIAAMARALENQCCVVHATTVGRADFAAPADVCTGAAAVYAPPGDPFPDEGVLAVGEADRPGWIHVDLDLDLVETARRDPSAPVHHDWDGQGVVTGPVAEVVDLR